MYHWQWTHHLKNYEIRERDVHCVAEKKKKEEGGEEEEVSVTDIRSEILRF